MTDLVRERLKTVPNRPGCYLMRDRRGVIIYIGKAKNLKKRVSSYFRAGANHAPKVRSMVATVHDFEFMTVRNEAEALLTEASLIKRYKPHFNILMRDDKRYLALRADPSEKWPRFRAVRIVRDDGAMYFGPFPSAPVVRTAKDFVEKRYGIRECDALTPDAEPHRHCLADVIRTCSAPCIGKVSAEEYRSRFDEACAFLSGERPGVFADLAERINSVKEFTNHNLRVAGVLVTFYNGRTNSAKDFVAQKEAIERVFQTKVFEAKIRRCQSLVDSNNRCMSVFDYAPKRNGALDYDAMIDEYLMEVNCYGTRRQ